MLKLKKENNLLSEWVFYHLYFSLLISTAPIVYKNQNSVYNLLNLFFYFIRFRYYKVIRDHAFQFTKNLTYNQRSLSVQYFTLYLKTMRWKFNMKRRRWWWRVKFKKKIIKFVTLLKLAKKKFSFLKYINYKKMQMQIAKIKAQFSIIRRIFLNAKFIRKNTLNFFYKKVKKKLVYSYVKRDRLSTMFEKKNTLTDIALHKKKSLIFLNIHKKFYWKLRQSRITHWNYWVGNRLNKHRYIRFFKKFNKVKITVGSNNLIALILAHAMGFFCSWRQIYLLVKNSLIVVNGRYYPLLYQFKQGDIIELCYGVGMWVKIKKQELLTRKIYYRLKKWASRLYLNYSLPKRKRLYKPFPKSIKSLGLIHKIYGKSFMGLRSMGLVAVIYPITTFMHEPVDVFYKTTILKLHNWRYKY